MRHAASQNVKRERLKSYHLHYLYSFLPAGIIQQFDFIFFIELITFLSFSLNYLISIIMFDVCVTKIILSYLNVNNKYIYLEWSIISHNYGFGITNLFQAGRTYLQLRLIQSVKIPQWGFLQIKMTDGVTYDMWRLSQQRAYHIGSLLI